MAKNLQEVVEQLNAAVIAHGKQAKTVEKHIKDMKNNSPAEKKGFPEIKEKNEGKFTKWVEKNMPGKSTCAAASKIMKSKKKYKPAVVKMANYANNFGCKKK
tara:strand:+ start:66 stop:371 length:306 start_codon:yes stop_codon:yes gene_type:complete